MKEYDELLQSSEDSDVEVQKVVQKKRKNSSQSKDKKRKVSKKSQEINDV